VSLDLVIWKGGAELFDGGAVVPWFLVEPHVVHFGYHGDGFQKLEPVQQGVRGVHGGECCLS